MHSPQRHEREQAKWRIVIGSLAFIHFIFTPQTELSHLLPPQWISGLFLLYALLNGLSLKRHPAPCHIRRRMNMVMDLGTTSLVIGIAGEAGTPLIAIYLWVIMGNGFRYGIKELNIATGIALFGFSLAILFSTFWSKHLFFSSGFFIVLSAIPFYMGKLLGDLQRAIQNANQANQAKSDFLSNISHDLRTPLNGITGMNEMLLETSLNTEQREYCEVIQTSATHLLELIERLLTRAQTDAGKLHFNPHPFDLQTLLTETQSLFQKRIEAKQLHYLSRIGDDVPTQLIGDALQLKQALNNLLGNALKFTEQGQIEIRVSLREADTDNALIRFEIQDSGIGMSQQEQQNIFNRFQQAHDGISHRYGGTGLGLALVNEQLKIQGSQLQLSSHPNHGSTFWFELNFEMESNTTPHGIEKKPTTPFSIEAYQRTKNPDVTLNILAADDNELNRTIIEKVLQRAGHHVTLVNDGNEALEALGQQSFDLAILDINMDHLGGLDVLKTHRFKYPDDPIPMLMLSADATELTINRCLSAGAAHYLTKPLDSKRLLDAINDLALKNHQQIPSSILKQAEKSFATQSLINHHTLTEITNIDPEGHFVADLIKGFQHDGDTLLRKLKQALQTPIDFLSFKNSVHALKGNAAELGADKLFIFCQQAEKISLRELHQQKNQTLYKELEHLYRATLAAFQEYIDDPPPA